MKTRNPAFLLILILLASVFAIPATVPVRHSEGLVHGFLALRTLDGETIADGDLVQYTKGNRVTTRLTFHFKDGSLHDETAIYTQQREFRLLKDHLVQKGPSFETQLDMTVDAASGTVNVRSTNKDGKEETYNEHMKLSPDIANGLVLTLLKNIRPGTSQVKVSMVAATPKPRLVKLAITPQGEEPFATGGAKRKAMHYAVKVEITGIAGVVAPIFGKQPPDTHVWILEGEAPAFVKFEGQLAYGGPIWRIELVSPTWPKSEQK